MSDNTITDTEVLSAPGARYPAPEEARDMLALLSDGTLHVVRGRRADHVVLAYMHVLRQRGAVFEVVDSDIEKVRALYAQANNGTASAIASHGHVSNRQGTVIKLIRAATKHDSSDMHFIIKGEIGLLRHRVNGVLEDVIKTSSDDMLAMVACIYQSMCDVSSDPTFQPNKPQDARMKKAFLENAGLYGARVATRPTDDGLFCVLRLLYKSGTRSRSLTMLGYSQAQSEAIRIMTRRKEGINIFSGPTGSGKSTSLEVLIGMLIAHFDRRLNVITLEDPPEYVIVGAVQTPVIEGDWSDGIRNLMRLDPDVIMVGEMRDGPSARAAFQAAMTGHGVWTTLHANDAVAILQRLGDIGVDPGLYLDPSNVTGLINQSLVRRLCDHCKKPWLAERATLDDDLVSRVERWCRPESVCVVGDGCAACDGTGVAGRTAVDEVLVPTLAFMTEYQKHGKAHARAYWVNEMGGVTKTAHLIEKINAGQVDPRHGEENVGPIDTDAFVVLVSA